MRLMTRYERIGYKPGSSKNQIPSEFRVTDTVSGSWECMRHSRHILICLNERAEAERLYLLKLQEAQR